MRGVNKAIIIGTLGQDPEIRHTANGNTVANISVATSEQWKGKDGQKQEKTEWHRITIWGKLAEIAGEYLRKGSQAYFEGRIETRKWQDQSGNDRYTTEIVASEMQMLGGKSGGTRPNPTEQPRDHVKEPAGGGGDGFDEIPFAPVDWRV